MSSTRLWTGVYPMAEPAMKVGVNLLWLIPGVVGGSEEYTIGLLEAVAGADEVELTIFAQPTLLEVHPHLADAFKVVSLPRSVAMKPARFAAECSWLAVAGRRQELMHHGGGVAPFGGRQPMVVTVHDLQPLELASNFSAGQQRWFKTMLPRVARRANRVITPSQYSADRVVELLGVDSERLAVVPPVHTEPASTQAAAEAPGRPFLLYPAVSHPHKRHIDAVAAIELLQSRHPQLRLIFTGRPGASDHDLRRTIEQRGLGDRVDVRGRVPAETLDQLLRQATAVVFPSVYEGFGNPILEAMSRNTPVIAANATAIPEVAGDAALLFQPGSPRSLAEAIDRLLRHPDLADDLRQRGLQRAAMFDSQTAGRALINAYRDALR